MNKIFKIFLLFVVISFCYSCQDKTKPGYEYMPDMYRTPPIETYAEHSIDGYDGLPVEGTIARGKISSFNYDGTTEGYLLAGKESTYPDSIYKVDLVGNVKAFPFTNNEKTLEDGEKLYGIFCAHCHGINGEGNGSVTHPAYSAVPAYNDNEKIRPRANLPMSELKEGHIYHAITYGLNAMGPHASQINEEERWKIVLYIQEKLQNYGK
tara:strand:+ start:7640 stop:8266 length:627 start_codon:yes stop_codon:yes gene_type:complete